MPGDRSAAIDYEYDYEYEHAKMNISVVVNCSYTVDGNVYFLAGFIYFSFWKMSEKKRPCITLILSQALPTPLAENITMKVKSAM